MNENELKKLFDRVEKKYLQCWEILSSIKTKADSSITIFQGLLCEALIELSRGYRNIHQARQALIKRKSHLSKKYFTNRQRVLERRQKDIIAAIGIGRTMGDAFVWPFFHNDRELLEEHSKHQYSVQMPPGFGGIGEMMFMKNVRLFGEYMVIYHGITTILRIGDITFIDLKKIKVAGIGEIKTSPLNKNELNISIIMNFTNKSLPAKLPKAKKSKKTKAAIDKLPNSMKDRLKRQMHKISDTLSIDEVQKPKTNLKRYLKFYYREFDELLNNSKLNTFSYSQFGDGLLCAVYRQNKRSMYAAISSKSLKDINSRLDEMIPRTEKLLLKGSQLNNIKISFLMYTDEGIPWLMPGAKPLFWWPINIEMIRRIIFHECLVVSIYNPAHLLNSLKKRGYVIIQKEGKRLDFKIERIIDKKRMVYENFWFFFELITQSLIRESEILEMILSSAKEVQEIGNPNGNLKAEFRLYQMF